jgi:integrase
MAKYPTGIYPRGETLWISFYSNGKKYSTSAKTMKVTEAKKLREFYLGEVARGTFKGFHDDALSMQELFDDFEDDCKRRKLRGVDRIRSHMKPLRVWFGAKDATQVNERAIDRYIKHRLALGRTTTTVNRELQYLGQSLRRAKKKKLMTDIPLIEKFSEKDNVRQGFFTHEDFERLVSYLPNDLKDFVRFGYLTGWRHGMIRHLVWSEVEGDVIRLGPEKVKNKNGLVLPLVGALLEIIEQRRRVKLEGWPYVFYRTTEKSLLQQVGRFDKAWKSACAKAGLPTDKATKRRFHDLRRTTARNLNRAGVPDPIAMALMGHKTRAMYDRYNIVDEDDMRAASAQMQDWLRDRHNLGTINEKG